MIEITALFCYNLSMKTQERSAAEWRALLDKKEDEIAFLHRQIDWLTQQLRLVRGQRFGASSEQTQALLEQVSLFQEAESESCAKMPEPELEQVTYKRRKQKGKRELDIHIFSDQSSLEIFSNGYQNNHSNNVFAGNDQNRIFIRAQGGRAVIREYESYGLEECFR